LRLKLTGAGTLREFVAQAPVRVDAILMPNGGLTAVLALSIQADLLD
jgi:hypothetical protein